MVASAVEGSREEGRLSFKTGTATSGNSGTDSLRGLDGWRREQGWCTRDSSQGACDTARADCPDPARRLSKADSGITTAWFSNCTKINFFKLPEFYIQI